MFRSTLFDATLTAEKARYEEWKLLLKYTLERQWYHTLPSPITCEEFSVRRVYLGPGVHIPITTYPPKLATLDLIGGSLNGFSAKKIRRALSALGSA